MSDNINSNMEYAIYLRKSRKDMEAEMHGEGETLARHEKTLLSLAKKMNLLIGKIYREVVSGDSIVARPQMQQLLQDVENGLWTGVLVMEVERLARGNTLDQGIVSNTFKYASTKIITPVKTYDPNNEFDEEYFEFGLFMSRREYNTIKRRLHNGTLTSVKEGKFVVSEPPYGYERYKLKNDKGYSLKIKESEAEIVRLIFEMYTSGYNLGEIKNKLNAINAKPKYTDIWWKNSLQAMLCNVTYVGKIKYTNKKTLKKVVNGQLVRVKNPNPEIIIVDGLHEAIIDEKTFNKAQEIYHSHQLQDTRTKEQFETKNPLATLIKCKKCGKTMKRITGSFIQGNRQVRLACRNCDNVSSFLDLIENKLILSLEQLLKDYELQYQNTTTNDIEQSLKVIDTNIKSICDEIEKKQKQKTKLYDLLEQGIYDNETFLMRSKELANKLQELNNKLSELQDEYKQAETIQDRKATFIPKVRNVIETYQFGNIEQKNKLLKSVLVKVTYYREKNSEKDDFELILYPRL